MLKWLARRAQSDHGAADRLQTGPAPSVFIATLPKSGTDFTVNSLLKTTGLKLPEVYTDAGVMERLRTGYASPDPRLISTGNFDTQTLNVSALKLYLQNGHIVPTHMAASHHNLMSVLESGHRKISVIMRDPRDATVSLTYHIAKAGPDLRNLHSEFQFVPPDYHTWPHEKQVAYQARIFLPRAISWIESWLWTQCDAYEDLDVQFMHFDDLKHDSTGFLKRVGAFHGVEFSDLDALPPPDKSAHFRSGLHEQWRSEFSDEAQEQAEWLLQDRLATAYRTAVQWRIDRAETGPSSDRIRKLATLVWTFPWVADAYLALKTELERQGNPVPDDTNAAFESYLEGAPAIMVKPWTLLDRLNLGIGDGCGNLHDT
ncbi:MAG: sulfotransferase domain-containing protein [Pseudomonadota bacterium]